MSKDDITDLARFLEAFPEDVKEIVFWLRAFVWDLYPETNELIYDNYNALAFGWSISDKLGDTFCSIAVGRTTKNIHFGFYWGSKIADPDKMLLGKGNQYRYILVTKKTSFPKAYITTLLSEAYNYSKGKMKGLPSMHSATITKSISAVKPTKKSCFKEVTQVGEQK